MQKQIAVIGDRQHNIKLFLREHQKDTKNYISVSKELDAYGYRFDDYVLVGDVSKIDGCLIEAVKNRLKSNRS